MHRSIRPVVLALITRRRDDAVLVTEVGAGDDRRVRPVGGGIEFGETARTALDREVREELGCGVSHAEHLVTVENIFTSDDVPGHEIVFAYRCDIDDELIYSAAALPILDAPQETAFWWTADSHPARIVPEPLAAFVGPIAS